MEDGNAIIVTGAAGGIGSAIAARFARDGARLLLADVDEAAAAALAGRLRAEFRGPVVPMRTDVSRQEDNEAMVAAAVREFGRLDVLVNNAAVGSFGRITDIDPDAWRRIFAVGVDSIFFASRAAMPHLARAEGAIVNVGSISGLGGDHHLAAYNSMKGAVANLTRSMAIDHASEGVRVNAVAPGSVRTPNARIFDEHPEAREAFASAIPMGRRAEPDEVAAAVAFLASREASYITGINLVVDGGLTAATGQPDFGRLFGDRRKG